MADVLMYTTRFCPYCIGARRLLDSKRVSYTDIAVDGDAQLRRQMTERSERRTVPQIWIGEQHIGGFSELAALEQAGKLDAMLSA